MGPKSIIKKYMTKMTTKPRMSWGMEWSSSEVHGHGTETTPYAKQR
jgi:hypothetical protein